MKLLDEILAEERAGAEWAALWQIRIDALEADLRATTARAEAAAAKLAAVPWGAIGRILDRIETPEDRYAVALWHLENRGM